MFKTFETTQMVVAFPLETTSATHKLLLGEKTHGPIEGFLAPPGGHIEPEDHGDLITACQRETLREVGLNLKGVACPLAKVEIILRIKRSRLIIWMLGFTEWQKVEGRPPEAHEFKDLQFYPLDKIPWGRLPPGDSTWMRPVLLDKKYIHAQITCGVTRTNVEEIIMTNPQFTETSWLSTDPLFRDGPKKRYTINF